MPRSAPRGVSKSKTAPGGNAQPTLQEGEALGGVIPDLSEEGEEELVLEGKLVCALTGEPRAATTHEETLQSFIEQLHREYDIALADMQRDIRVSCVRFDEGKGKERARNRAVSLVVYESGTEHRVEDITHVAIIARAGTKADKKAIEMLDEVLANVGRQRDAVYGIWTNGGELQIRMRTW